MLEPADGVGPASPVLPTGSSSHSSRLRSLVELTGGIRLGRGWYQVTATDPVRLLFVAAGVVAASALLLRTPSLRERLTARRAGRTRPWQIDPPLGAATRREWLVAIRGDGRRDRLADAGSNRRHHRGARSRRSVVLDVAARLDRASARRRSGALVEREHLPSRDEHASPTRTRRCFRACSWRRFVWLGVPIAVTHGVAVRRCRSSPPA